MKNVEIDQETVPYMIQTYSKHCSSSCQLQNQNHHHHKDFIIKEAKLKYKNIIIQSEEKDCIICLDPEAYDNDQVLLCNLCNASCHQSCYGSDLLANIPEGLWLCQRCSYLMKYNLDFDHIKCAFCPELKGLIKMTNNHEYQWAHVACVNWIPEIFYLDLASEIASFENYSLERKNLTCVICRIPYGDCIQCDQKDCLEAFHVTCAQRIGIIRNYRRMKEYLYNEYKLIINVSQNYLENLRSEYIEIYCKSHLASINQEHYQQSRLIQRKNESRLNNVSYILSDLENHKFNDHKLKQSKNINEISRQTDAKKTINENLKDILLTNSEEITTKNNHEIEVFSQFPSRLTKSNDYPNQPKPLGNLMNINKRKEEGNSKVDHLSITKEEYVEFENLKVLFKNQNDEDDCGNKKIKKKELNNMKRLEDENDMLYKFKPIIAGVFGYWNWMNKKSLMNIVIKYIFDRHLLNKQTLKVEYRRDPTLSLFFEDDIPKSQVMNELMNFVTKKSKKETIEKDSFKDQFNQDSSQVHDHSFVNGSNSINEKIKKENLVSLVKGNGNGDSSTSVSVSSSGSGSVYEGETCLASSKNNKPQSILLSMLPQEHKENKGAIVLDIKNQSSTRAKHPRISFNEGYRDIMLDFPDSSPATNPTAQNPLQKLCNQKEVLTLYDKKVKFGAHAYHEIDFELDDLRSLMIKMQPIGLYDKFQCQFCCLM